MPRDRFNADAAQAPAGRCSWSASTATTVDYHLSLGETEAAQHLLHGARRARRSSPRCRPRSSSRRSSAPAARWDDDLARALVARVRRRARAELADRLRAALPRLLQDRDRPGLATLTSQALERVRRRRAVRRRAAERARAADARAPTPLTRLKLYKTGGKVRAVRVHADARGARACASSRRCRRACSATGRRRLHARLRRAGLARRGARPRARSRRASSDAIAAVWRGAGRVRLAEPAGRDARGLTWRAGGRSCAPTGSTASASRRAFTEEYQNDALAENPDDRRAARRATSRRASTRPRGATTRREDELRERSCRASTRSVARPGPDPARHSSARSRRPCAPTPTAPVRESLSFKLRSADGARDAEAVPAVRDLRVLAGDGGIHLRGGMVARGGIRWSDRREDYRTEVLGLMKAQMVKNAVIVPDGSKGGFILKRAAERRDELLQARCAASTSTFMRGLLDITDNLVDGAVVHPERRARARRRRPLPGRRGRQGHRDVLRHGQRRSPTSTASGWATRSRRAARRGYDHKALGITARGAWESRASATSASSGIDVDARAVHRRRHRRHVGRRVRQRDAALAADQARRRVRPPPRLPRSRPRPGASLRRARSASSTLPGSSWDDYDRTLISPGGGVFPRNGEVDRAHARGARRARHRRRRDADAERADARRSCARPSTCSGTAASART